MASNREEFGSLNLNISKISLAKVATAADQFSCCRLYAFRSNIPTHHGRTFGCSTAKRREGTKQILLHMCSSRTKACKQSPHNKNCKSQ